MTDPYHVVHDMPSGETRYLPPEGRLGPVVRYRPWTGRTRAPRLMRVRALTVSPGGHTMALFGPRLSVRSGDPIMRNGRPEFVHLGWTDLRDVETVG